MTYLSIYLEERLIYYKELAHVIMEADKSPDLHLENWGPRRADGIIPVQMPAG